MTFPNLSLRWPTTTVLAAMLAALCATPVVAQDKPYFYGGISVGAARGSVDEAGITARQLQNNGVPVTVTGISIDDKDTAYRIFGGYQMNKNFGLEASYFNLGRFSFRSSTSPNGALDGQLRMQGGGLDLVGTLPLGDKFALLGRVGGQYAKTRDRFSGTGAVNVTNPTPSARQFNYKAGVGAQYTFNPNFLMRLEADQYRMRDAMDGHARVHVYSISAVFPFGAGAGSSRPMAQSSYRPPVDAAPPAPVAVVMAPTPAMAAPMAAPVTPTPAPLPRRVSFSAESLFGFDHAEIRPEGKTALDSFAREVKGTQFDVIVVEGHADRLGSAAYNQKLSLERAVAVKSYLVTSGGFDGSLISAVGMGETAPVTQTADCKSTLHQAELRACLQPDRRVDVEVKGTKTVAIRP